MIAQIQVRRGTTAEWAAASHVVLAAGEPGYDTTLKMLKLGDGSTEWASLESLESETLKNYPVGAIYQSTVSTSPATLFGGTWAALGGRMLIGVDGTYTAGSTGGAATHTLTTAELAAHNHNLAIDAAGGTPPQSSGQGHLKSQNDLGRIASPITPLSLTTAVGDAGSGSAHNNMPPYLAVYMWERTA